MEEYPLKPIVEKHAPRIIELLKAIETDLNQTLDLSRRQNESTKHYVKRAELIIKGRQSMYHRIEEIALKVGGLVDTAEWFDEKHDK